MLYAPYKMAASTNDKITPQYIYWGYGDGRYFVILMQKSVHGAGGRVKIISEMSDRYHRKDSVVMMYLQNKHDGNKFRQPEGLVLCHPIMLAEYSISLGIVTVQAPSVEATPDPSVSYWTLPFS